MSDQPTEVNVEAFIQTLWREIDRAASDSSRIAFADPANRKKPNPFAPGEIMELLPGSSMVSVKLREAGLDKDPEFVAEFTRFLASVGESSIWGLLAALDGASFFEGDHQYRVIDGEGRKLPMYLLDMFHKYRRKA